jgi:hypothetical protein
MPGSWDPDRLLAAVQEQVRHLVIGDAAGRAQASLEDGDILVTFHWPGEPDRLGMRFDPSEAPTGPSTGEACDSPTQWATEVIWVLTEELETGLARRAPRSRTASGVVELRYRPGL